MELSAPERARWQCIRGFELSLVFEEPVIQLHSSKVGENIEDDRPLPPVAVAGLFFQFRALAVR